MTKQTIPTTNTKVIDWVNEIADLTQPDAVYWCDGSEKEIQAINNLLIETEHSLHLIRKKDLTVFWLVLIPKMLLVLKHEHLFVVKKK